MSLSLWNPGDCSRKFVGVVAIAMIAVASSFSSLVFAQESDPVEDGQVDEQQSLEIVDETVEPAAAESPPSDAAEGQPSTRPRPPIEANDPPASLARLPEDEEPQYRRLRLGGDANEDLVAPTTISQTAQDSAAPESTRFVLPPLLFVERGTVNTTVVFPGFYLREEPGNSELVIPPFYHREGELNADVLFPAFWWWRGEGHHTWVVPPVFSHSAPDGHDFGIAPLVFTGRHTTETGAKYYHLIPPLLAASWGDENEDYLFAGALFYRIRQRESERFGLFPFLWVNNSPTEQYTFVAPAFFRWSNPAAHRTLTLIPPLLSYLQEDERESFFGVAGLFHHNEGRDAEGNSFHSTTIPAALFHYSEDANAFRLTTPLFAYVRDHQDETLVTWLYQRHRGAVEWDGVMPLFFHHRDPRNFSEMWMISPLAWQWGDPASSNFALVPLFGSFEEFGRRSTWVTPLVSNTRNHLTGDEVTWIMPTIQVSRWHDGDSVNIHPLWYYESVPSHQFNVLAPFWFDFQRFADPVATTEGAAPSNQPRVTRDRYTVAFPFYWRFFENNTETQVAGPSYYRRIDSPGDGRWEYEFHGAGLFDFGDKSNTEHWWRVLYGLVGFERRRTHDRTWVFWIPIDVPRAVPFDEPLRAEEEETTEPR